MKKFLFSLFILNTLYLILYYTPVDAQTVCTLIYGGGQTCVSGALLIDKKVLNPATNQFVDNLGVNDPKYQAQSPVFFRLALTNTGSVNLSNIVVKDIFPQFVDFSAGAGNFDQNSKTLSFTIDNLASNETKTFTLMGRTVQSNQLPLDRGIVCVVNQSAANSGNISSQDNAQFCIEKVVPAPTPQPGVVIPTQPVTKGGLKVFPAPGAKGTPPTGPEALVVIPLLSSGLLGHFLRKISWR